MLVYVSYISPRLQYILNFFSQYYQHPFKATTDAEIFRNENTPRLNYSAERISQNDFQILPHFLLSETFIKPVTVECFRLNGFTAFFRTQGDYPFDILSATFYLLSRYEEYYQHRKDEYGRYAYQNSLAFREGFLNTPLVNAWLEDFRKVLEERFSLNLAPAKFKFIPTYDIDIAWSYRNKGFTRTAGGLINRFIRGDWKAFTERIKVLMKKKKDPYDSYDWLESLHRKFKLHPVYFFHSGLERNQFDKNISVLSPGWQKLVRSMGRHPVGLHPSWASGDNPARLEKEKKVLENVLGRKVNSSRQHYIRFTLPDTFRNLLSSGITEDYSMGYGSINGFRASFAGSFYWYDLQKEEETGLLLYPFCFMDANSFFEQKQNAAGALEEMKSYFEKISLVNGTLITIWHNTFLGEEPMFHGWKEAYENFISFHSEWSSQPNG